MVAINQRARRRRLELELTQRQVAKACRVTQQAYEKFERGETKRPRYIYELAKTLKVSPEWLLTGEEAESVPAVQGAPADSMRKIAVYSFSAATKNPAKGLQFSDSAVIDRVAPLPGLENTPGAVALFLQGDDFGRAYPHATTLYIDRHKYPALNHPCLCLHEKGTDIVVYQGAKGGIHNFRYVYSGKPLKLKSKDVKAIYRIVGILYA